MTNYSSQAAADALGISLKKLNGLIAVARIVRTRDPRDGRKLLLSQKQFDTLAAMTNQAPQREFGKQAGSGAETHKLDVLEGEIANLKQRVGRIEQLQGISASRGIVAFNDALKGATDRLSGRALNDVEILPDDLIHAFLSGAQGAVIESIQFLNEKAPSLRVPHTGQIVITSQSETDIFDQVPLLRTSWQRTLRRVLNHGWDILHLIPRGDNQKLLRVAGNLTRLLGARGNYVPAYITQNAIGPLPREFIFIPNEGILEFSATTQNNYTDSVSIYQSGDRHTELSARICKLRDTSAPVLMTYPRLSAEFSKTISRTERQPGNLGLYMYGFSERTIPIEIHQDRIEPLIGQGGGEGRRLRSILESRVQRREAFERTVRRYLVQDICPLQAIESYLTTGIYSPDDMLMRPGVGGTRLMPEQIEDHLRHIIYLLRQHKNYELGILDNDRESTARIIPQTYWMVKQGYNVLIETWGYDIAGVREEFDIEIREHAIVEAFWDDFTHLWESLPDTHKDRNQVIGLLEGMIPRIRRV